MKDAVGTYKLSGLRNFTGGDLDVNMQKATLRLGQFNGNSFTSYKDSADRTTRVDFNAKNISIDNFVEINNRVGSGAGRKASSTVLTLQASEGITSSKNAEISLYDGATLNLASNSVKLMGNVWMGRLQYVGAYLAPSYSTINTSKVTGEVNFNHLTVGDKNAAQAGIIASNKTHIGTLDLWQSAGLNIIAPPEGGYKDKPNNTTPQSGAKNDKQQSSNSNTQVINPPNSTQKTEIQPTQVIDGPFAGGKDTVVNIDRINTKADGTIKVGGYKASLTTNAAHLNIGKGGVNLSNQASGRSLLVENLTGNITVDGPLRVNNQVGGYALAGSSANFEFKAGTDTKNGTATFNNDISLGRFVNLKVDAHTANFKGIDTGNGGFNTLDFSGVTGKVNINKLITASTNVAVKNFNINELLVKTNGVSVGEYTHFSEDIGSQSRINTVRLETGTRSIFSGGVKFKGGEKLVIDEFYYSPWNYFDARNIKNVEITRKFASSTPENPWAHQSLCLII